MTPREIAENFMNRYITKKIGGGEMLSYLEKRIAWYSAWFSNRELKAYKKDEQRRIAEAYQLGFNDGYQRGLVYNISHREICLSFEISPDTYYYRKKRGWSIKRALTEPVHTEHSPVK